MHGLTHNSEDSSEFAFLLVENYIMTTLYGLRIVWEFLAKFISLELVQLFIGNYSLWIFAEKRPGL